MALTPLSGSMADPTKGSVSQKVFFLPLADDTHLGIWPNTPCGFTADGGFFIFMKTGESLRRGEVVASKMTDGVDGTAFKCPTSGDEFTKPVGVVYQDCNEGGDLKVVVAGIAYVLPTTLITATRGKCIFSSDSQAGRVGENAAPSDAEHWRQVGTWIDTGSANGVLCRAILHFN